MMKQIIRSFSNEMEASLASGFLVEKGIPATVMRHSRYRAMGGGGYSVQCEEEHLVQAKEILDTFGISVDMDEYVEPSDTSYRRCPNCNSVNLSARPLPNRLILLSLLGLGIPFFFIPRDRYCCKCSHEWRN